MRTAGIALAIAAALAVVGATAGAGRAAVYVVQGCAGGAASGADFGAWTDRHDALYGANRCAEGQLALGGVAGGHLKVGNGARYEALAPDGTTFTRWSGVFRSTHGTAQGVVLRARACHAAPCSESQYGQLFAFGESWGAWTRFDWAGSGARALQLQLSCTATLGCPFGAAPPLLLVAAPEIHVDDPSPPVPPLVTGGSLVSGGWRSARGGQHTVEYQASDRGGGVAELRLQVDGAPAQTAAAPCAGPPAGVGLGVWPRLVPCPLVTSGQLATGLAGLADGPHALTVTAVDAAGSAARSGPVQVKVDSTPPTAPVDLALDGPAGWRNANDFAVRWSNPAQAHAPLAAVRWRLCPTGADGCVDGAGPAGAVSLSGLAVAGPGEHELSVWLEDAAGNHDAASARSVRLRLDTEAPRLAFRPVDPGDPLVVTVAATDRHSGVAAGEVEVRRTGAGAWRPLATRVEDGRLVAEIGEGLPEGAYEARARATDHAGNHAATDRLASGAQMTLAVPAPAATTIRAAVARGRSLRRAATVALGARVTIRGRLSGPDAEPLRAAPVTTWAATPDGGPTQIGTVHTDARGRFSLTTRIRRSTVFGFRYDGSRRLRGSEREVTVHVPAASTIRASRDRLPAGEGVVFSGRLLTRPVPRTGKLVEVQSFFRDRWRTFSTVRADRRGRWRFRYRFTGTVGVVRYRFRVRLPEEGGYPFDTGHSGELAVTVRGP